jgi:hypothetical protein
MMLSVIDPRPSLSGGGNPDGWWHWLSAGGRVDAIVREWQRPVAVITSIATERAMP